MNKKELLSQMAKNNSFTHKEASKMMQAFIKVLTKELSQNKRIKITGLGTFYISKRKARRIVHPQDKNRLIKIGTSYKPSFKPTQKFMKKLKASS
jgi:DNA-binding protein HU-beta